jgi:hypothetical protein
LLFAVRVGVGDAPERKATPGGVPVAGAPKS